MKRKGFTLIELLAVIVILAIIALIATPIVLNIIENTKEEANERSVDMYATGVKNSIAKYQLKNTQALKAGNYTTTDGKTLTHKTDNTVFFDVEYDGNVVCETIMIYENGNIYLADCKVNEVEVEYIYGTTESICKLVDDADGDGEISLGDEYLCAVEEGMNLENDEGYTFYVLGNNLDGTTNLILERNICEDGTLATSTNTCSIEWYANVNARAVLQSGSNTNGPVTAMNYLYNATADWITPNIVMNYTDEGSNYGTIITTDNITKITTKEETTVTVLTNQEGYTNLKARLPKKSEVSDYDKETGSNKYLYDYMIDGGYQTNEISNVYGYWTLASNTANSTTSLFVSYEGSVSISDTLADGRSVGVRPVITVQL